MNDGAILIVIMLLGTFLFVGGAAIVTGYIETSGNQFLRHDGTIPLSNDWDAGAFDITQSGLTLTKINADALILGGPTAEGGNFVVYQDNLGNKLFTIDGDATDGLDSVVLEAGALRLSGSTNRGGVPLQQPCLVATNPVYIQLNNGDALLLGLNNEEGGDISVYRDNANNKQFFLDADAGVNAIALQMYGGIAFRDSALTIMSKDDGHIDVDTDISIDLNALTVMGGNLDINSYDLTTTSFTFKEETGLNGRVTMMITPSSGNHPGEFAVVGAGSWQESLITLYGANDYTTNWKALQISGTNSIFYMKVNKGGSAALQEFQFFMGDTPGLVYTIGIDGDITFTTDTRLEFRDPQIYLASLDNGHLDVEADTSIDLNAPVWLGGALTTGSTIDGRDIGGTHTNYYQIRSDEFGRPNVNPPNLVEQDNILLYEYTVDTDNGNYKMPVPDDYVSGDLVFTFYWTNDGGVDDNGKAVKWEISYQISAEGEAVSGSYADSPESIEDTYASALGWIEHISGAITIEDEDFDASDCIFIKLMAITPVGDPLTCDPNLIGACLIYTAYNVDDS